MRFWVLFFLGATSIFSASFSLKLSRSSIQHLTTLISKAELVDSAFFDLDEKGLDLSVVLPADKIPVLNQLVVPFYAKGEIFSVEKPGQKKTDLSDFAYAFGIRLDLTMDEKDSGAVFVSFSDMKIGAFYKQDLKIYQKAVLELGRIESQIESLKSQILQSGKIITAKELVVKNRVIAQIKTLSEQKKPLQIQVEAFRSGSNVSLLPSDELLSAAVLSVSGQSNGDEVMGFLFENIKNMKIFHPDLQIKLLSLKNRRGKIRIGNLAGILAPWVPGLYISRFEIVSEDCTSLVLEGNVRAGGGEK